MVNTEVSVADWILNSGCSISGYDIAEANWIIEQKLEEAFEEYKKRCPEPQFDQFDHYENSYYYDKAHARWEDDAQYELAQVFESIAPDIIEEHFHPADFLAESLCLSEEEVQKAIEGKDFFAEDLDKIVKNLEETSEDRTITIDDLKKQLLSFPTEGAIGYEVYTNYRGGSESRYFLDKKEALAQLDIPKQEFLNEVNQRGVRYMKDEFYEVTITEFSGKGISIPTSNQELAMMIKDDIEEKLTTNVIDTSHYDYESYIEEYETYHEFDFDKPSEKAYDKRDDEAINTILKEKCDKASTLLKDSSIDWFITEAAIVNLNSECFSQGIYYDTNENAFLVNKDNYCFPTFDDVSSIVDGLEPINIACFALKGKKIQQEIKRSNL